MDDDGDGQIDEGCFCGGGETQPCFRGMYPNRGVGACADGVQRCDAVGSTEFGHWGACEMDTLPSDEACDGADNDCDGATDEGCPCTAGQTQGCGSEFAIAPCRAGTQTCRADGTWSACEGAVGPSAEVCDDGVDNDCDGLEDEGCSCVPEPEICDDGVDNDCDGTVDEPSCRRDMPPLVCGPGTMEVEGRCVPEAMCSGTDCTPDVCNSSADCPDGGVCLYESGECVDAAEFQCDPPPADSGAQGAGEYCGTITRQGGAQNCAEGLRCVYHRLWMNDRGEYGPSTEVDWGGLVAEEGLSGRCVEACNPCEGDCDGGRPCIGLEEGGGFCAPAPLAVEGELCRMGSREAAWCEAGTTCVTERCRKYCVPDDPRAWSVIRPPLYTRSADCDPGEVCQQGPGGLQGAQWYCVEGEMLPPGQGCGRYHDENDFCEFPATCTNGDWDSIQIPGTCSSDDPADCSPPASWRFEGSTLPQPACVSPGAVMFLGFCEEDVDCAPGLTCQTYTDGRKHCLE